jgi:hypothetical protein
VRKSSEKWGKVIFIGVGMVKSEGSDISGVSNFDESERFRKENESD